MNAAAEIKKVRAAEELTCERFVKTCFFGLKNGFHFVGDSREFLKKRFCGVAGKRSARFSQMHGEKQKRGELRSEGFRRGHANFGACVGDDGADGFASNHGADNVANGECGR